jgi:uncharacterized protein (TIGR02284 family)
MDQSTLPCLQELIHVNFAARDELYAAAAAVDDEGYRVVCQRLADQLAGHAVDLQQIVLANEGDPGDCGDAYVTAEKAFHVVKRDRGETGVITAAESCERDVRQRYNRAIESTSDLEVAGLLKRQCNSVVFGEHVLRSIARPTQPR